MNNNQPISRADNSFAVTAIVKLAHTRLLEVIESRGGVGVCAKELCICDQTLRAWLYLRSMPICGVVTTKGHRRNRKNIERAVKQLCIWAEASPEELFPGYIRDALPTLKRTARITREITPHLLANVPANALTYEPDFTAKEQHTEQKKKIAHILKTLSYREREIIKLRYGLTDGFTYTLEEVRHIFKVTRERIRGIEAKAIRKLQQPSRTKELISLL